MEYNKWVKVTWRHAGYGKWDYLRQFRPNTSLNDFRLKLRKLYGPCDKYNWMAGYWENKNYAVDISKRRIYTKEHALIMLNLME